jgi:hypothetical protein
MKVPQKGGCMCVVNRWRILLTDISNKYLLLMSDLCAKIFLRTFLRNTGIIFGCWTSLFVPSPGHKFVGVMFANGIYD